ncbi:MAG: hypothetical protein ACTSR8_09870 [Promethearchaeota archaeon]
MDWLSLRKKINRIRKKFHDTITDINNVKICTLLALPGYLGLVFIGILVAYLTGGTQDPPGTYSIFTHWISDLGGSPYTIAPYLYDLACIFAGALTIPLTFYLEKLLVPLEPKTTRLRYRIGSYAFLFGIIGNIGYIFVGIFSEDRNYFGITHNAASGAAFIGFQISAFFTGWIIILYNTKIPKWIGLDGMILPITGAILYAIWGGPFLEWMMLFLILAYIIPLSLYILHNEELHLPRG